MKKISKTAFRLMLVVGLIGFGTAMLSASPQSEYVEKTALDRVDKQLSISDSTNISIEFSSRGVYIGASPDDTVHITYYNTAHFKYEIEQSNNELVVKQRRLVWGNFDYPAEIKLTVLIPKQFKGGLSVDGKGGRKTLENIFANSVDVISGSGGVNVAQIACTDITIDSGSGGVNVAQVVCTDITIDSGSGGVVAEQVACTDIIIDNGSGGVTFSELNAQNISLESSSGGVRGSIVGNSSDFSVTSRTRSGDNNLPSEWGSSGNKTLDVSNGSGGIDVRFAE